MIKIRNSSSGNSEEIRALNRPGGGDGRAAPPERWGSERGLGSGVEHGHSGHPCTPHPPPCITQKTHTHTHGERIREEGDSQA
ncbi:hypothetical protein Q5P01_008635 [Channa striata]|uniref:Uncharacterized protein n=1 Tax=Channa striata TaxID=64152 RepID=A0AA88N3S3_CHASR|nr:hypothetical protein Q5P01_008635 [Channa striata]